MNQLVNMAVRQPEIGPKGTDLYHVIIVFIGDYLPVYKFGGINSLLYLLRYSILASPSAPQENESGF